jgi:hypothetical protein
MVGAAVTALTAGAAGIEGAAAGFAAAQTASTGASSAGASSGAATAGAARALPASTGRNLPAPPQSAPSAASSTTGGFGYDASAPTLEGHADLIRNSISNAMGTNHADEASGEAVSASSGNSSPSQGDSGSPATKRSSYAGSSGSQRRGPSVHRYNVGTWGAYHAARIAASGVAKATRSRTDED